MKADSPEVLSAFISFVNQFIKKNKIKNILEIGCGNWKVTQLLDLNGANYTGIDVVESVIVNNNKKHSSDTVKFKHCDIFGIEESDFDLIICKDVLQYLPVGDISLIMNEIVHFKKAKHFIVTHEHGETPNQKIKHAGQKRSVDIMVRPFGYKAFNQILIPGKITQFK